MPDLSNILTSFRTRGVGATLRAGARAIDAELRRRRGQRFVERGVYSYRMRLDLEDRGISRTLLLFGEREVEHKIMLERVLKPGMSVLDIGANIGYYALMELEIVGPKGQLIAVEPSPSNVSLLKANLELNGYKNIEVHQMAVSDQAATRAFFMSEMSNLNTFHNTGTGALHLKGETIDVRTTTVPAVMAGRPLDLIRMDVEGHEVEVLSGLVPPVESGEMMPMVIFETHLSRYTPEHNIEVPLRRLFAAGYHVALAGSSSERGTGIIEGLGYRGIASIPTDDVTRVLFENISDDDAVSLICRTGGIRTLLLAPKRTA